MSKFRMISLHKLGFLITQGWLALYSDAEIEDSVLSSFDIPSKLGVGFQGPYELQKV